VLSPDPAEDRLRTAPYRRTPRRAPGRKLIPLLFFVALAGLIAYNEIPAFAEWWERLVAAREWEAKRQCQQAALAAAANPAFARVVKPGKVHQTAEGLYIDGLVLGEMADGGVEQRVEYSCYLDSAGKLVQLNRL
jgi:hypothetical protein